MSIETGGYSPERQSEGAVEEFKSAFTIPETEDIMPKVIAKIKRAEGPDGIRNEIKKLDKQLADTDGEPESKLAVLEEYVGGNKSAESDEDDEDDDEEIDDEETEGWGSDDVETKV